MSDRKITDRDYLFLSSMLKARESRMLTRDRLEQIKEWKKKAET